MWGLEMDLLRLGEAGQRCAFDLEKKMRNNTDSVCVCVNVRCMEMVLVEGGGVVQEASGGYWHIFLYNTTSFPLFRALSVVSSARFSFAPGGEGIAHRCRPLFRSLLEFLSRIQYRHSLRARRHLPQSTKHFSALPLTLVRSTAVRKG